VNRGISVEHHRDKGWFNKQEQSNSNLCRGGDNRGPVRVFDEVVSKYPGLWRFIDSREQLTLEAIQRLSPVIFFSYIGLGRFAMN